MLLQVALLVLSFSSIEIPDDTKICDDGSSPWEENGQPNWRCTLDGCLPLSQVCWEERLDICYEDGVFCDISDITCEGLWDCFVLAIECDGKMTCTSEPECLCETAVIWSPAESINSRESSNLQTFRSDLLR